MDSTSTHLLRHPDDAATGKQANAPVGPELRPARGRNRLRTARRLIAGLAVSALALSGLLTAGTARAASPAQTAAAASGAS